MRSYVKPGVCHMGLGSRGLCPFLPSSSLGSTCPHVSASAHGGSARVQKRTNGRVNPMGVHASAEHEYDVPAYVQADSSNSSSMRWQRGCRRRTPSRSAIHEPSTHAHDEGVPSEAGFFMPAHFEKSLRVWNFGLENYGSLFAGLLPANMEGPIPPLRENLP